MKELEKILKHEFKKPALLQKALTHGSVNSAVDHNYERLEFLGDRVLGLAIASLLYKLFPQEPEGNLSQRFTGLVCKETVAEVGRRLQLGKYMRVANAEIRENENVLCDVCEAVIGAIYIDSGVEYAIAFVDNHWRDLIDKNLAPHKDSKTLLQEVSCAKGYGMPHYELVERTGSEHEPTFAMKVVLSGGIESVIGTGRSKKLAEFDAATKMLEKINR